jgi:ubiquinone biosynthesis protein COQ9
MTAAAKTAAGPRDWAAETESRILDEALTLCVHMGWTRPMTLAAGRRCGLSTGETDLLLPHGPRDLAALLSRRHDAVALAALPAPEGLKIRQRIRSAVEARLEAAAADREALRRWAGYLSLPLNLPLALRLVWESADKLWRWAGDTATDENHYSKRAILSAILISTTAIDMASGREAALAYLDARIQNVMDFEKWKAGLSAVDLAREVAGALASIRYGRA